MNDKELSTFGEKLYEAVLITPLGAGSLFGIVSAIREGVPWARLPAPVKLAVLRIAAQCVPEEPSGEPDSAGPAVVGEVAPAEDPDGSIGPGDVITPSEVKLEDCSPTGPAERESSIGGGSASPSFLGVGPDLSPSPMAAE